MIDVAIVGAGMAGLACARRLAQTGLRRVLFDKGRAIGGRVASPPGQPFLREPDATLHLGGDWCVGPRVEAAWAGGAAIADDLPGAAR